MKKNDRNTYTLINIDSYLHNLNYIKDKSNTNVIPVLKADAYGHGKEVLSKEAEKCGYNFFAVAFLNEAIELINNGLSSPILIFNYFNVDLLEKYLEHSKLLIPTITSLDHLKKIINKFKDKTNLFKFHINLNTGIFRNGITDSEFNETINLINYYNINIDGVYTHFATADENDEFLYKQLNIFKEKLSYLKDKGLKYNNVHFSNSAASLLAKFDIKADYVRAGIASFGLQPSNKFYIKELKPVLSFHSVLSKVYNLNINDTVGYGRTFKAVKPLKAGVVPVGYADGYFRNLSNKAEMLVNGVRCKILGRVSMDQIVIDVNDSNAKFEDEVILIGQQGDEIITAEYLADLADTINYEITSTITKRVNRVYYKGGNYFE